ncbi:MAG TPA: CARDB domain-containing protein [Nitrospira sp.]|nr:CARDB domain-containing protein [Nitrospira sp.]
MVPVNLSLVFQTQQAQQHGFLSPILAFLTQWATSGTAWAQSVSDITAIEVQISAPDLPAPVTKTQSVSNPTSGQIVPITMQVPAGSNRTITVAALNGAQQTIFSGTLSGVTLMPGTPANLEVTLRPTFTVTVEKQGGGQGTVTSSPAGINCGATCAAQFDGSVSLNAAAAPGSVFAGWSGGGCSGTGGCTVTEEATVTATFNAAPNTSRLTVVESGGGSGTVTSSPSGINCGSACFSNFATGSTVVLTATASGGSTFAGWSGGICSGTGPCTVVMSADQTVTATFNPPANSLTLTVVEAGTGSGTITSTPAGITCGTACSAGFAPSTVVTLTATPAAGSTFSGWSGGGCSGTGPCVVVMNGNQTVTATFAVGTGLPNLVVKSISFTPTSPSAGQTIVFTAVVQNIGTADTPYNGDINAQGIGVSFTVDNGNTSSCHLSPGPLAAGATLTLRGDSCTPYVATSGSHTVVAFVDDVNRIAESNETDNMLSLSFSVRR